MSTSATRRPWLAKDRADTVEMERRPVTPKPSDELVSRFLLKLRPPSSKPRLLDWIEVRAIQARSRAMRLLDDEALVALVRAQAPKLLHRGLTGESLRTAAAGVREMTRRRMGISLHPVQTLGGLALLRGRIVEMATGEGKTVTNLIPATVAALTGIPVHIVTVNDYLSERDSETLRPVLEAFGLSVGHIVEDTEHDDREGIYARDIVFATNKTFAFDYLRDRVAHGAASGALSEMVRRSLGVHAGETGRTLCRGLGMAIVDEVDSVLIDEAQTPLIITAETDGEEGRTIAEMFLELARSLRQGVDYRIEASARSIRLLPPADEVVEALVPPTPDLVPRAARRERLAQALSAIHLYRRDEHYILRDGDEGPEIAIVDEFTGRVMADRQWQRGLHQMIEAKEGINASPVRRTLAQITYQTFFNRYMWFAGMTGTAREIAAELRLSHDREVLRLPTHRRIRRRHAVTQVYGSSEARWHGVVRKVAALHKGGQPVLIGVRSVEASEHIANLLRGAGMEHFVLNARQDADEAAIVAEAGKAGRITVATNMAGRGTDIPVAADVEKRGGLAVILTEFHSSSRIDRQLYGRAGRQGQRGLAIAMVSLEDSLFVNSVPRLTRFIRLITLGARGRVPSWTGGLLRVAAQSREETRAKTRRLRVIRRARQIQRSLAFTPDRI